MRKNVQALDLDLYYELNVVISSEEIGRFERLRYPKLNLETFNSNLANSLTNLRWIVWSNLPRLVFKPNIMRLKNVIVLEFSQNDFINDWK